MAISKIKEQKAIKAYIETNGNKTKTYLESHPNSDYNTARAASGNFIANYNIEEKAMAILEANPKLNHKTLLNSLSEECEATKSQLYKGKEHITPDYSTRLLAKRTVLLDLYGLGNHSKLGVAIQTNIVNVNPEGIEKVSKGLADLFEKANALVERLNNAKEI